MASALISQSLLLNLNNNNIHNRLESSLSSRLLSSSSLSSCFKSRRRSSSFAVVSALNSSTHSYDVVIVGAGIIGLTIAHKFLVESDLSVAVVDADVPCAGATGAGTSTITATGMRFVVPVNRVEIS